MAEIHLICFSCQKPSRFLDHVGYREECAHCRADMHVCKNCEFYDSKSYNECRESSADPVKIKDRSNFCDYFKPSQKSTTSTSSSADTLRSAAEALFKKKPN